ncbi:MAG TPA: molybdopterin molybdotransferase MoeA [Steroidobacteraceae bacterium]|nr:molybdopterin molybdotransferase MoeA [Steroidobacteraceae bacterium]
MSLTNISVENAQAAINQHVQPLPVITRPLRELSGAILAQSIYMERDQPPFDRVAMDGIAFDSRSAALQSGLKIAGTQAAGATPLALPSSSHCIEVMTGAVLPAGCDCVIPVERIRRENDMAYLNDDVQPEAWLNVHRRGSDAAKGDEILKPGARLRSVDIAAIASAGYASVKVHTMPRVAVISTGDELIEPGKPIEDWQIRRSNSYALLSALHKHGFTDVTDVHLRDDPDTLRTQLSALLERHDALVISGGVSTGRFDFVPQVLNDIGVTTVFHKVRQRPGRPMWFGARNDGKVVYALPGNPVSVLMCMYRYVLRGLLRAMGMTSLRYESANIRTTVQPLPELVQFLPVVIVEHAATVKVKPWPTKGSGDLVSLLGSDGFVEILPGDKYIATNTTLRYFRW